MESHQKFGEIGLSLPTRLEDRERTKASTTHCKTVIHPDPEAARR